MKVLLCVTGGIAAYKAIELAGRLKKNGLEIKTVLTENALKFITELNFKAITQGSVHTDLFCDDDPIPHISLADWADLIVVAPATANVITKAAHGLADDLLSALLLAHTKPVLWVPAMNVNMYDHPATRTNIKTLTNRGHHILEPATGMLACGYEGKGKFPSVEEVEAAIQTYLHYSNDLKGKKLLVTAGGTSESIDPMRTITNRSSGKTGIAIARAAALRGAEVHLVYGNLTVEIPYYLKEAIFTSSAAEMKIAVDKLAPKMDIIIMAAAVSDFKPVVKSDHKIKKSGGLVLKLAQTEDILAGLGKRKKPAQILVGFAAETEDLEKNARVKLKQKKLDMIIANHLSVSGKDATEIMLITGSSTKNFKACKFHAAHLILDEILGL